MNEARSDEASEGFRPAHPNLPYTRIYGHGIARTLSSLYVIP